MKVLITGGAGYIGSTIASACLDAGHLPVVLDDLSTGVEMFARDRIFYRGDVADARLFDDIFRAHPDIAAVIHCASHIVVPESVADPLQYYRNNVSKAIDLLSHLGRTGCRRVLFSSSGSIYAASVDFTVDEGAPLDPQSPYARSKAMVEQILADAARAGLIDVLSLRYFNPVGADPQLRTGPQLARPTQVLGRLLAAQEDGTPFTVAGADWPTRDGSAIRDYVHVWDVAQAHVRALAAFDKIARSGGGFQAVNIGTGRGTTVRELARYFAEATDADLAVIDGPRRPGDVVGVYARVDKARTLLGWCSQLSIPDAIRDALAWSLVRPRRA
jgi:UDP-glucose 4-epimerase